MKQATRGEWVQGDPQLMVERVVTDSRTVQAGDLFVALAGEHFDGHDFVAEAFRKGAVAALVNRDRVRPEGWAGAVVAVGHTRVALGQLAGCYRGGFDLPVIAVGGSNGKTTTKEILATLLRQRFQTLASPASYNNDIGVPLTLLNLDRTHQVAVVEVGTNHPGELAPLVSLAAPRFGVLTSIGREHLEFFGDLEGVLTEESGLAALLPARGTLVLPGDAEWVDAVVSRTPATVVRVGTKPTNNWRIQRMNWEGEAMFFEVATDRAALGGSYRVALVGRHQVVNAVLAMAVSAELGLSREEIERGLAAVRPVPRRLELWAANGLQVLDDAYNANADSMVVALETLAALPCAGRRIAVLGDMAELGATGEAAHAEVGRRAAELGVDQLIAVGAMAGVMGAAARAAGLHRVMELATPDAAAHAARRLVRKGDLVLVKASRATRLEQVSEALRRSERPVAIV